ncbi:hypothetical protein CFH99_21270 [Nocardioides aromaticivorans]|uniref:DUF4064 domain-containing protein n=1 Tax=Nocardioides aromaticivorans TaxID=200618 RepID=A0ABX7PQI7_9ACTN|nr:hypothetical protein [Nocardioides aromaticivorans]QSR28156.1 hypothetical protein CFH99_21270 [Nocardioides aromaticivorans]
MSEKQPRPPQATFAGVLIIGGSLLLIAAAWQRVSTLHTLEAQRSIETWLSTNNLEGMTVDGLVTTLRVLCIVGGGAAAASTILGFQVFQRSLSARIALAVLAPLLFLGALASNVVVAAMAVFGIGLLWAQPTRDWYAGRPWLQPYQDRRAARVAAMRSGTPTLPGPQAPPPAPADPSQGPPPAAPVPGLRLPAHRPDVVRRPGALLAACILTWVLSALTVVLMTLLALVVAAEGEEFFAELKKQEPDLVASSGITEQQFVASFLVIAAGLVLWAMAALVLAVLAFTGQNWARIALAVSGVCATMLTLVMTLSGPPLVVVAGVLGVGTWLLLRPEVVGWYRLRRHGR